MTTMETTGSHAPGHRYLFNKRPLVIRPALAKEVGLNGAIILQQVHYWCQRNEKKGQNQRDGYTWTYGSYQFWQSQFPWWSLSTVRRTLNSLEGSGLLVSGPFNRLQQDRTKWYRIDYEALDRATASVEIHSPSVDFDKPCAQNEQMQQPNLSRPLPETTTETNIQKDEKEEEDNHHAAASVLTFFRENMNVEITPVIERELRDLVKDFPERVKEAIRQAARHRVSSPLPYIRAVLENERDGEEKEKGSAEEKEKKPTFKHAPNVLKLVKKFGKSGAEARIDYLSLYKASAGKGYESDHSTIILWDRRGNPDGTPWDPEPPDWQIIQEWLDSLQPKPLQPAMKGGFGNMKAHGPRTMTEVTCRKCGRQFNAVVPKHGVPRDVCQKCVRAEEKGRFMSAFEWQQKLEKEEGWVIINGRIRRAVSFDQLTFKEQRVLELRFGLKDGKHPTREIANELHVCASRVRELEINALLKLYGDRLSLKERRQRFAEEDHGRHS